MGNHYVAPITNRNRQHLNLLLNKIFISDQLNR